MAYSDQAAAFTIEQQHAAILACCDELLGALRSATPTEQVGKIRLRLAGLLHANLASEEMQVNAPIRRLPVADRPREFAELNVEAAELRRSYSEHVVRWTLAEISREPSGYARAAAELVRLVKLHLNRKKAVLPDWKHILAAQPVN